MIEGHYQYDPDAKRIYWHFQGPDGNMARIEPLGDGSLPNMLSAGVSVDLWEALNFSPVRFPSQGYMGTDEAMRYGLSILPSNTSFLYAGVEYVRQYGDKPLPLNYDRDAEGSIQRRPRAVLIVSYNSFEDVLKSQLPYEFYWLEEDWVKKLIQWDYDTFAQFNRGVNLSLIEAARRYA